MGAKQRGRRWLEPILSIGATPDEPEVRRSGRRVFMVAFIIATLFSIPQLFTDLDAGYTWVAIGNLAVSVFTLCVLAAIAVRPRSYVWLINLMFVAIFVGQLVETAMFGGLLASGLVVMFGIALPLAALLALDLRSAIFWFVAYLASIGYALVIPDLIAPLYTLADPVDDAAFNLAATGVLVFAVLWYFVRERDRFQRRSDDLLHAILPDEIAERLKDDAGTIADDIPAVSVLFADVVDFTPMSAAMSPGELVALLNHLFSTFDGFVAELGLEKIKTVGDAYMVAAGVPHPRDDHAHAIAELALRIRDHVTAGPLDGRPLLMRVGIASGLVTAGVIGTRKFAYDLWGDTVNTASRMESSGIPGRIQMSRTTFELIRDAFVCEPRGSIEVKGKDRMETYLLVGRASA